MNRFYINSLSINATMRLEGFNPAVIDVGEAGVAVFPGLQAVEEGLTKLPHYKKADLAVAEGIIHITEIEDSAGLLKNIRDINPDDVILIDYAKYDAKGKEAVKEVADPLARQIEQLAYIVSEVQLIPKNIFMLLNAEQREKLPAYLEALKSETGNDLTPLFDRINILEAEKTTTPEFADSLCEKFPEQFSREPISKQGQLPLKGRQAIIQAGNGQAQIGPSKAE